MKKSFYIISLYACFIYLPHVEKMKRTDSNNEGNNDTVEVYTTVYPLQYFAERIGGESVNVALFIHAGANEHTFEPTQKDMMALADADLFFYIGLGLEGFVENAKKTLAGEHVNMVATIDAVPEEQLEDNCSRARRSTDDYEHESEFRRRHEGHDHGDIRSSCMDLPKNQSKLSFIY